MTCVLECLYCGKTWEGYHVSWSKHECSRCKDQNIKVKQLDAKDKDPFGYNYNELEQTKLLRNKGSPSNPR